MLTSQWRPTRDLKFRDMGTFDNHLVLLLDFEGELQLSKIRFTKASFWIRLYDLPLKGMNARAKLLLEIFYINKSKRETVFHLNRRKNI